MNKRPIQRHVAEAELTAEKPAIADLRPASLDGKKGHPTLDLPAGDTAVSRASAAWPRSHFTQFA